MQIILHFCGKLFYIFVANYFTFLSDDARRVREECGAENELFFAPRKINKRFGLFHQHSGGVVDMFTHFNIEMSLMHKLTNSRTIANQRLC